MYNKESNDDDVLNLTPSQKSKITTIGIAILMFLILGLCSSCKSCSNYPDSIMDLTQEQYDNMRAELNAYRNYYHAADSIFNCCIDSTGDTFFETDEGILIDELSAKVDSTVSSHAAPED